MNMATTLREVMTRTDESELIPAYIYDVLIRSVRANLVGTQVVARRLGPQDCPGSSVDIVLNTTNTMRVDEIAEGAEYRKDRAAGETFNLKPLKYGMDIGITKEMIEDSKFAIIEWQLEEAGYQMARKLDSLIMAQIDAGAVAASQVITGTAAITVTNISNARKYLRQNNFNPDVMIVSPEVEDNLLNIDTFHEADKLGSREVFERGTIGRIMGMTVLVTTQATALYAYVIDSKHALIMVEKRPITIERYKQENMDLVGIAVSARWKVRYLRSQASAKITTTG